MAFTDSWRIVKQQTRAPNAEVDELHRPGDLLRVLWQFEVQAACSDGVIIVLEFELAALKRSVPGFLATSLSSKTGSNETTVVSIFWPNIVLLTASNATNMPSLRVILPPFFIST